MRVRKGRIAIAVVCFFIVIANLNPNRSNKPEGGAETFGSYVLMAVCGVVGILMLMPEKKDPPQ